MTGDVFCLAYFFRGTTMDMRDQDPNKLNILSGLLHVGNDFMRAFVMVIVSAYMLMSDP